MALINYKQEGGPVKPYVTNNPKDPRIQAYQDSLSLYLDGERNYLNDKKEVKAAIDQYNPTKNKSNMLASLVNVVANGDSKPKFGIRNIPLPEEQKKLPIAPIMRTEVGDVTFKIQALKNLSGDGYMIPPFTQTEGYSDIYNNFAAYQDRYKKPVQPVVYKPTPAKTIKRTLVTKKTTPVSTETKPTPTSTPETPQTQPKKPITYKNETFVQYVREQNPERTDVNRQYNQAGNSHLVKKEFIRRVPVNNEETQTK